MPSAKHTRRPLPKLFRMIALRTLRALSIRESSIPKIYFTSFNGVGLKDPVKANPSGVATGGDSSSTPPSKFREGEASDLSLIGSVSAFVKLNNPLSISPPPSSSGPLGRWDPVIDKLDIGGKSSDLDGGGKILDGIGKIDDHSA